MFRLVMILGLLLEAASIWCADLTPGVFRGDGGSFALVRDEARERLQLAEIEDVTSSANFCERVTDGARW